MCGGFIFGTICLIALVKMLRRGRCGGGYGYGHGCGGGHCGGGHCGHGGWGSRRWGHGGWGPGQHGGGWGGGHGPGEWMVHYLSRELGATPAQERALREALGTVRETLQANAQKLRDTRATMARALQGDNFDEGALGEAFAQQDEAIAAMRKAAMDALGKVHLALEPEQRRRLSELLARGPFAGRGPWQM